MEIFDSISDFSDVQENIKTVDQTNFKFAVG
jgi:hypothetical protein